MAMTAAMRRPHERLPEQERYPLTPREIVDSAAGQADVPLTSEAAKDITIAAHLPAVQSWALWRRVGGR